MKLGSLLKNDEIKVKYCYCKQGLCERYNPDAIREYEEKEFYENGKGNLFSGNEVAWDPAKLVFHGIDIRFSFSEVSFADSVSFSFGDDSGVDGIEIYVTENDELKKVGNYSSETGEHITKSDVTVPVGVYADNLTVRLHGCCMPISIKSIDILGAWEIDEKTVWPMPEKINYTEEKIDIGMLTSIRAKGVDELFVAGYLKEQLFELNGMELSVSDSGNIKLEIMPDSRDKYRLCVKPDEIIVSGSNRRSLLYGVSALLQIIGEKTVKCCDIENEDFMDLRGVHIALFDKKQLPFMENMIKRVFVPMHYNMVFIEIAAAMRYDRHPKINEAWLESIEKYKSGEWPKPAHYEFVTEDIWEKDEVSKLCRFFESYGIEVVPEIQSWGHTQYITGAYPETAEKAKNNEDAIDLNVKDVPPSDFYHHTMCPNHEKYYDITFDIIGEVLEAVKPKRFVHMGHDEIYTVGACEICSKIPRGEIFAKEVTRLNNYIKDRGLNMMIWSDMLQNEYYSTPDAIDKIPKDIIMLDFTWYFHIEQDIEDRILSHGFQMMIGNLYTSHYPRFETRSKKSGIIGAEVSAWVALDEFTYGYEGKMYDLVMSASAMSSIGYNPKLRITHNEIIKPLLCKIREQIGGLECKKEERTVDICGNEADIPYDIRDIVPYESVKVADLKHKSCDVRVDSYAEIITFINATDKAGSRVMWNKAQQVGEYVICFEDGDEQHEPITYAGSIYKYRSRYGEPIKAHFFRHEGYTGTYLTVPECGKTHNGEDYTIGHYSIRNKTPDKKIKSVRIGHFDNNDLKILLFGIKIK